MGPSPLLRFLNGKQRLLYRMSNLYGSQTSPVVSCMQNSVISTRITNLYGSQTSPVVFAFKTARFVPDIHVSTGPRYHLSLFACNTACFAPELLVSMEPSPHLRFLHAKQRLLYRISNLYGSQISPVVLCMQNRVISTRNTSLYGTQPSSVDFTCKTHTFGPEKHVSMGPRHHLSFCACNTV